MYNLLRLYLLRYLVLLHFDFPLQFTDDSVYIFQITFTPRVQTKGVLNELHFGRDIIKSLVALGLE